MEFLNIHLQLALINSSQRPMKSIIKKYPTVFCDENAIKSLINTTIFNIIHQCLSKDLKLESFSHLENYFFKALWNEVGEIYPEEREYSLNAIPYNEVHSLINSTDNSTNNHESVEDQVIREDSFEKLCGAIKRLEVSELRNRSIRNLKKSPFLKQLKKDNVSINIAWLLKRITEAEALSGEELSIIQGFHFLVKEQEVLTEESLELLSCLVRGKLSAEDRIMLLNAGKSDDKSSNLYGFAERFIEQACIHSSLENGNKNNRKLISGQRHMIRRELSRFRRG